METKVQSQIDTVAGIATFVKTVNDAELWAGDYSTRNGYWVIHRGANHHVYKVKIADARIRTIFEESMPDVSKETLDSAFGEMGKF